VCVVSKTNVVVLETLASPVVCWPVFVTVQANATMLDADPNGSGQTDSSPNNRTHNDGKQWAQDNLVLEEIGRKNSRLDARTKRWILAAALLVVGGVAVGVVLSRSGGEVDGAASRAPTRRPTRPLAEQATDKPTLDPTLPPADASALTTPRPTPALSLVELPHVGDNPFGIVSFATALGSCVT
jgi:hypothetical protein